MATASALATNGAYEGLNTAPEGQLACLADLAASSNMRGRRIAGYLLGGGLGDAIGLPHEGLTRRRVAHRLGTGPIEHALILRRGMLSDDTEHTCMTAQALLRAPDDVDAFTRSLAWRLRLWLLGLPASVGLGTLRAICSSELVAVAPSGEPMWRVRATSRPFTPASRV